MKKYEEYSNKNNLQYIPSYTNFITLYTGENISKDVAQKLLEQGIIVRDMTAYGQNAIRITIGRKKQNIKVFNALDKLLVLIK